MKRLSRRQLALSFALGLSLAATAWVASREEPEPLPAAPRRKAPPASAGAGQDWPGPATGARTTWPEPDADVSRTWGEPPLPPAQPRAALVTPEVEPSPDEATALPFPYRLVGRMTDSQPRVVLDSAQRSLVLGAGELVDGQWRIEAIEASGLRVKRLPDGPSQFIAFSPS